MTTTKEFYEVIDGFAPFKLSEELCSADGLYDNSGIIADCENSFDSVLVCLDLTYAAVEEAAKRGCGLILTHHPAIYRPVKNVDGSVLEAVKMGISVISAHLNLDCAKKGVDYFFAKGLGANGEKIIERLSSGGYGRSFKVGKSLKEFVENAEKEFSTRVNIYGNENAFIGTAASFCGEGLDEQAVENTDVDLYCSADVKHHVIKKILEEGKSVISFTHYSSENYGMKKIAGEIEKLLSPKKIKIYFFDDRRFI